MALLRAELKGEGRINYHRQAGEAPKPGVLGLYEGIIEAAADLALPRLESFDPGSMLFCMENGKIYIKNSQDVWTALNI